MGYVPPSCPLPGCGLHPFHSMPHRPADFGQQWIGDPPKDYRPDSPYRRYVWDLYGPASRNWLPLLNALAIGLTIALTAVIGVGLTHMR